MYCPSCGNAVAEGLKFCNRCGESLGAELERAQASSLTGPAWAISLATTLVTLGGLSMLFVIGLQLVNRGSDLTPGASVMMLAFLLVIALVDWLLIRQLARVIDLQGGETAPPRRREPAPAPPALEERQPPRLDAMREPPPSVVDQTTRTLERVPRERDTRPQ
jgi:predicted nucleic acid-binding Zn ribbon protein